MKLHSNVQNSSFEQDTNSKPCDNKYIKNTLTPYDYAAIYARKSNPKYSHSIDAQIELGKKKIDSLNLILYKVYSDELSATTRAKKEREKFEQLKIDIKLGKFKNLIVFKRDRLSRKIDELLELRNFFKEYDIKVYYTDDNEYTPDGDDYYSDFIENVIIAVSQLEPDILTERIIAGKRAKWERREYCHGIKVPFGYINEKNEKKVTQYFPDEKTAPLIRNLFAAYIETNNNEKLEKALKRIEKAGGVSQQKDYYIKNPVYAGLQWKSSDDITTIFKKNSITGEYFIPDKNRLKSLSNVTPIIDSDTWYKAILKWRYNYSYIPRERHTYIFKGIAYCSICKNELNAVNHYYKCSEGCTSIRVDLLEKELLKEVVSNLLNKHFVDTYVKKEQKKLEKVIQKNTEMLKDIDKEKQKYLLAYMKHLDFSLLKENIETSIKKENMLKSALDTNQYRLHNLALLNDNIDRLKSLGLNNNICNYLLSNKELCQKHMSHLVYSATLSGKRLKCDINGVEYVGA